ncbi:heptosyltransferase [Capnocytophaga stomatis]|uniref:ADP-heptose--LPS heptosyltransferase RfaF n=1 Tax=Capnocytophaga stomatis TaxID=1848904 RepID=A0A250FTM1_9FLAO|nr:glycosyltransferase family 9 protein [Capnocytophaga stomatis]ATA88470.1 ADP-heptose--LPS heptosyltransferase RfaF [Capnocytophaga stomatis]GIJ96119.1 heptosyltransferase [Capnocytophaga stomatis]
MAFKHIAVFRMSAMGDVAISVPVLTAFAEQYPDVKITFVTRPIFAPMFTHIPNCEVFNIDLKGKNKGISGLYRLFKELKNSEIEAVVDIHNVLRTNILKIFFKLSGIPFFQIDKGRKEKKALTRPKNKIFKQLKPSYQRYADVFEKLGFPISLDKNYFVPKPKLSEEVKNLLSEEKNIGIAPFASHLGKQYPFENLKYLIFKLSETYPNSKIYIFGGGEHERKIVEEVDFLPNVENMVGRFSFETELQLIANLDVMVAMDSGNAHLAAMYGVPTITIWGVTHPFAGFYPYGQPTENALLADRKAFPLIPTSIYGNKYPKGYERAIKTIKTEEILTKIEEIITPNNKK